MLINERLLVLRKTCRKTQAEFASILGMSQSGLADIESGRRNVTERHLIMLSNWNEYNVNIDWLRTGEGEMFLSTETDMLEKVKDEYRLSERQFKFVSMFLRLPEDEKDVIMRFLESVFADPEDLQADQPGAVKKEADDIDSKVAEYRRLLEQEARQASSPSGESRSKEA